MDRTSELRSGAELQSRLCKENGSPTYSAIIDALSENLLSNRTALEILRADSRDVVGSALYLRFLGAVNRIALADPSCPLRRFFPSLGGNIDVDKVPEVFFDVVAERPDAVAAGLAADVQTNEVGRAAPLSAALNHLTRTGESEVNLLEVGASAGLNLWLDRYRVDAGQTKWGPPDSPVQLTGHFIAGSPPAWPVRGSRSQRVRPESGRSRRSRRAGSVAFVYLARARTAAASAHRGDSGCAARRGDRRGRLYLAQRKSARDGPRGDHGGLPLNRMALPFGRGADRLL